MGGDTYCRGLRDCEKQDSLLMKPGLNCVVLIFKSLVRVKPGTAHHQPTTIPMVKRGGGSITMGGRFHQQGQTVFRAEGKLSGQSTVQ